LAASFALRAPTQPNPPISLQSLRCNSLAVVHYSFVSHGLTFAVISARE